MKLVFVSHSYPPALDGVGDHSFFLAKELRSQGNEVHVICPASQPVIDFHHEFTYPIIRQWNWKGYRMALQKIKELQPNYIIIPYVPYAFNKWGMPVELPFFIYLLHGLGFKVCINFHEVQIRYTFSSKKSFPVGIIQRLIAFSMCRLGDKVVTSIEFYRNYLLNYTSKSIEIIPIPPNYSTNIIISERSIQEIRKRVAPNGERIIATYGIRDLKTIITVFNLIRKQVKDCRLLFCGKLNDPLVFEHLGKSVYITGYLLQEEVYTYLKAADVFYIPDPVDQHGRGGTCNKSGSLAAALVAGLPVVGTRGDLNNSLVIESEQIVLTDIWDKQATANAIVELLNKPTNKTEQNSWLSRLSWTTIAQLFTNFLSS